MVSAPRRRLSGPAEITAALDAGDDVRLILVREGVDDPAVNALVERASTAGVVVRESGPGVLWRFSTGEQPADVLALAGPAPDGDLDAILAEAGAVWLLVGLRYPGNIGFAVRTAEVSGAAGVVIDAEADYDFRRSALRASMHAERLMPVLWESAATAIERARAAGHRVIGVEDVGTAAPWEADLTGPVVFLIGGERDGVPGELLETCDQVIRVPMAGFIPSYNLQAAMSVVVGERLRQRSSGESAATADSPDDR